MGLIKGFFYKSSLSFFLILFLVLFFIGPLYGQSNVHSNRASLAAEITRLEQLSRRSGSTAQANRERYDAFLQLAHLHTLAGNAEAALRTYNEAAALFPGDGRILLEQSRILISFGEYQRARNSLSNLLHPNQSREFSIPGRYLSALVEAFSTGSTQALLSLSTNPDFIEYRSQIYYTLWQVTGNSSYQARLRNEFPHSPEGRIASAASAVSPAPTPLWLLFPGSVQGSSAAAAGGGVAAGGSASGTASGGVLSTGVLLQTGLFGREDNARVMADNLRQAGFDPLVMIRQVNGGNFWMVGVYGGGDSNGMIARLRAAGFESFPISL